MNLVILPLLSDPLLIFCRQVIDIYFGPSEEGSRQVITMPERPVFATISWSQIGENAENAEARPHLFEVGLLHFSEYVQHQLAAAILH